MNKWCFLFGHKTYHAGNVVSMVQRTTQVTVKCKRKGCDYEENIDPYEGRCRKCFEELKPGHVCNETG